MPETIAIIDLGVLIGIALLALGAVVVLSAKTASQVDTPACSREDPALTGPAQDIHTCPVLEAKAIHGSAEIPKGREA